jgi:thiol-disulfide isomerase/thioredoxin
MRPNLIILTILISALCGCKKTNEVNISGKISGKIPDKITYTIPVNGVSDYGFAESVAPDSLGNFKIKILTGEPSFVNLTITGINLKAIVVEPGQNFNISINTENKSGSFKISGANEAGQNLYNTFPNPELVQLEARKYLRNSSQDSVKKEINTLKKSEITRLRELLQKKEISKSFFELVSLDRDCYYAEMITFVQMYKFYRNTSRIDPSVHYELPSEMKKVWEDVYIQYPPAQQNLMRSRWWFEYAETYLIYKEYLSEDFKLQNIIDLKEKGLENTNKIKEAKKYFSGRELEYYTAAKIFDGCYEYESQKFEKEFIKIFDQFKTDFPESEYIKYLEPLIQPIVEFYKTAETDFAKEIKFIENYEKINSLKDVIKSFKREKVYVDVWATWCGSCKAEFKNRDKLTSLLKSKGIEIMYISIDNDWRDQQWKDMIKYYNLEGYHIRTNKQMYADLIRIFNQNGSISIPWHILIDENGNIVKDPSELEALEKGIK